MNRISYIFSIALLIFAGTFMSCGSKTEQSVEENDILVTIGDSSLTMHQVLVKIPAGLTPGDSASLFSKIVDDWVCNLALTKYACQNISDFDEIERMVENYRRDLIVSRYLQAMSRSSEKKIPEDRIKSYYEANRTSMVLEQPLVKGLFMKISSGDDDREEITHAMKRLKDTDIDMLEKYGMREASQYKFFNDEWVEWNAIAEDIPHKFGDADSFLKNSGFFELEDNGSVYLLKIKEYIPSGSEMPYDFAHKQISQILLNTDLSTYRQKLIDNIYKDLINKKEMQPGLYNPISRTMKKK